MSSNDQTQLFEKISNFRDVASSINASANRQIVRPGIFYRSGLPDDATSSDRLLLTSDFKIKTIIDLRTDSELLDQSRKHGQNPSTSPVTEPSDPAHPFKIPGIEYKHVSLNGHPYSSALIKQLSYWNVAKLFTWYALGYRTDAIAILGSNVMAKRGLIGLAKDSLQHSTAEVKAVFDVLSEADSYPVLVHCTQGKDRTGLVVLLVLLLMQAPQHAIDRDYMMSEGELASEREERLPQIRSIGLPDDFAGCAEGWVQEVSQCITDEYGGIEAYLERCGVTKDQQARFKAVLQSPPENS